MSGAGLDEGEADVARLIIDAEEVFRHAPVGGGDHDDGGVSELRHLAVGAGDADVVEAGGLGEVGDGGLRAGEEVDGCCCCGVGGRAGRGADYGEEVLLLGGCVFGGVGRVDADDDDIVVGSGVEAALAQGGGHAVEDLRAEHLAVVVHEREHDGAIVVEEVAELKVAACFVFEGVVKG